MIERGKYIVIEGSDGTGKSLQANETTERLTVMGYSTLLVYNDETKVMEPVQEPGGSPLANELRRTIKNKELERDPWTNVILFSGARRSTWQTEIEPALDAGTWVVTARSWISTIAYQGYGQGVDLERIRQRTFEDVGEVYMAPDLVCILALQSERIRKERINSRGPLEKADTFESLPDEFQANMQNGYVRFAEDNNINLIDASQTPKRVQADIWKQIVPLL